jgi:chitinase
MKPKIEFIYPLTNPFNLSVPQFINSVDLSCPVQYVLIAKMNLSIHAWDIDGNITKVEFYLNNQLLGEVSTTPYSFEWFIFNNGTYGLMVKAYDNLNGINQSEIIIINVISEESGIDTATDMIENDECLV